MNTFVEHLSVTPFGAAAPVLNDVSFDLAAGESALLLGPSGAGKSTLLLALSGVLQNLESAEIVGTIHTEQHGLLLQNYSDATISDSLYRDVAFGAESAGFATAAIGDLVQKALANVGLDQLGPDRNPATLSGGELQRACLAGLLTLRPRLLLLDEPTSQLDAQAANEVREAVADYLRDTGATALIVEHNFLPWLELVQKVLILDSSGRLRAQGTWHEVLRDHASELEDWGLWLTESAPDVPRLQPSEGETRSSSGSISALVGRSGAGKSTALRANLAAAMADASGGIGWLPQNPALALTENSVRECLAADGALENAQRLGLNRHLNQNPHELSGGEQRRLALAMALAGKPSAVFLDEPTVGLDRNSWSSTVALILEARASGTCIQVATHDDNLLALADEVIEIHPHAKNSDAPSKQRVLPVSPLALLAASFLLLIAALNSHSVEALAVAIGAESTALGLLAMRYPQLRRPRLLVPILIGALSVGFSNWWLSEGHDIYAAALIALRVVFFGLPGLLFSAVVSPSELGDQLGQVLRLPARPVVAGMVALNRIHQLSSNWENLVLVRKIRGLTRSGPRELLLLTTQSLIAATRMAEVAATAMESRGFSQRDTDGKYLRRTWAVRAKWGLGDGWLVVSAAALAGLVVLAG